MSEGWEGRLANIARGHRWGEWTVKEIRGLVETALGEQAALLAESRMVRQEQAKTVGGLLERITALEDRIKELDNALHQPDEDLGGEVET